ncbi:hypothetical protein PLEOSDRAFT_1106570 [Pleurotus ostreatus PC15]|uniref:Uncharacterized protein n=1 Tax=Pleurotus ostreatus (strain PC15) TaxID=1137138 RepID=A0A067NCS1_PLEO1|nr:hypothetical protein PLEOSDRAFT_1106570 [Pleurotus ostreatus PC15]
MRTRSSANWNTSAQNVPQPRRTQSSVSRSLGIRSIIPRPSTRAVALVGSANGATRLSRSGRPLGPIRHNKMLNSSRKDRTTVLGWLFDNRNIRYQTRQFDVKPTRNPQSIPQMDVFPVFLAPSRVSMHEVTVSLSSSRRHRFRIYGYTDSGARVNEALRLVSPHIVWRGEIAVFQLGQVVPYLGRPSVNAGVAHKAVRLFMAAVITAIDSRSTTPEQILAIPDVLVCKADAGQVGWRVERAKRRTFTLWDLLPWRFYEPFMRDLYIAYYLSVGYSEDLPWFPGTSRIYIHSAPFPTYAFAGVHNIKRVTVRLPGTGGRIRPFHYTVFTDRQASQDGFQVPNDILRNHNFGSGYEHFYGNVVAVKNECLPLSDGILRPYEEAVRVINATMEDTGIINDVLEVLIEDHTIGVLAIPADAIWVEVKLVGSTPVLLLPSPPPDPPHFPDLPHGTQDDEPASNTPMPPSSNSFGGLGGDSSTGRRGDHCPRTRTRRAFSLGAPEQLSHTAQRVRGIPDPSTWARRVSSLEAVEGSARTGLRAGRFYNPHIQTGRVLEDPSRGGGDRGRFFWRARQASSSHPGGRRAPGHTRHSSRGRTVRIQTPGDLTQTQAGGAQSVQTRSESIHTHAPGSERDVSPIDLDTGGYNYLDGGAPRSPVPSPRAAASSLWTVSPAPSPPPSDESDGSEAVDNNLDGAGPLWTVSPAPSPPHSDESDGSEAVDRYLTA